MRSLVFLMVVVCPWIFGQPHCQNPSGSGVSSDAGMFGLQLNFESTNLDATIVNGAIGVWATCSGTRPQLSTNSSSPVSVRIVLEDKVAPDNFLGKYTPLDEQITLYTKDLAGNPLSNSDLTSVLTHELGHALGLADVPGDSSCLMGPYNGSEKKVKSDDCIFVTSMWAAFCQPIP